MCAAALATVHAYGCAIDAPALAALTARAERYTGVEGGGMDQAIILMASRGSAKVDALFFSSF